MANPKKKHRVGTKTTAGAMPPPASRWWLLPPEIRNTIYEMAHATDHRLMVKPIRGIGQARRARHSILDRLMISAQWYKEARLVFASSTEFEFYLVDYVARMADSVQTVFIKNIVSVAVFIPSRDLSRGRDARKLRLAITALPQIKNLRVLHDPAQWSLDNRIMNMAEFNRLGLVAELLQLRRLSKFTLTHQTHPAILCIDSFWVGEEGKIYDANFAALEKYIRRVVTQ